MVLEKIDKKEIINGLETGIYMKEYRHRNDNPDEDDYDDKSGNEHTTYIHINGDYNVLGVKSVFKEMSSLVENQTASEIRMLTFEELTILKICNGMNTKPKAPQLSGKLHDHFVKK